jgi:hypothetical protein
LGLVMNCTFWMIWAPLAMATAMASPMVSTGVLNDTKFFTP